MAAREGKSERKILAVDLANRRMTTSPALAEATLHLHLHRTGQV
jgi:hypothetical protein